MSNQSVHAPYVLPMGLIGTLDHPLKDQLFMLQNVSAHLHETTSRDSTLSPLSGTTAVYPSSEQWYECDFGGSMTAPHPFGRLDGFWASQTRYPSGYSLQ